MIFTIIITAILAVVVYRLGLCDGFAAARGERLRKTVVAVKKRNDGEQEKIKRGIKNILDYGLEEK